MDEPAAWMWDVHNGAGSTSRGIDFFPTDIPFAKHTPLYTAPPKKEWVSLTDDEIYEAVENSNSVLVKDMARAVEAKLKEKNA